MLLAPVIQALDLARGQHEIQARGFQLHERKLYKALDEIKACELYNTHEL